MIVEWNDSRPCKSTASAATEIEPPSCSASCTKAPAFGPSVCETAPSTAIESGIHKSAEPMPLRKSGRMKSVKRCRRCGDACLQIRPDRGRNEARTEHEARIDLPRQAYDDRRRECDRDRAHHEQQPAERRGPPERALGELRQRVARAEDRDAQREREHGPRPHTAIAQDPQVDDRVLRLREFPPHERQERDHADDRDQQDRRVIEPVVLLAFGEHVLERREPDR